MPTIEELFEACVEILSQTKADSVNDQFLVVRDRGLLLTTVADLDDSDIIIWFRGATVHPWEDTAEARAMICYALQGATAGRKI